MPRRIRDENAGVCPHTPGLPDESRVLRSAVKRSRKFMGEQNCTGLSAKQALFDKAAWECFNGVFTGKGMFIRAAEENGLLPAKSKSRAIVKRYHELVAEYRGQEDCDEIGQDCGEAVADPCGTCPNVQTAVKRRIREVTFAAEAPQTKEMKDFDDQLDKAEKAGTNYSTTPWNAPLNRTALTMAATKEAALYFGAKFMHRDRNTSYGHWGRTRVFNFLEAKNPRFVGPTKADPNRKPDPKKGEFWFSSKTLARYAENCKAAGYVYSMKETTLGRPPKWSDEMNGEVDKRVRDYIVSCREFKIEHCPAFVVIGHANGLIENTVAQRLLEGKKLDYNWWQGFKARNQDFKMFKDRNLEIERSKRKLFTIKGGQSFLSFVD